MFGYNDSEDEPKWVPLALTAAFGVVLFGIYFFWGDDTSSEYGVGTEVYSVEEPVLVIPDCVVVRYQEVNFGSQKVWIAKCEDGRLMLCDSVIMVSGQITLNTSDPTACAWGPL